MVGDINPLASHNLPSFIVPPGQTDYLMVGSAIFLLIVVVLVGSFYFVLHSLPERMSHKMNRVQMEIVAVLALVSLFTHNHAFWIVALLLAFIRIPDFETPLYTISEALQRLAGMPVTGRPSYDDDSAGHGTPLPPPDAAPAEVVAAMAASENKGA